MFDPSDFKKNEYIPPVYLTDFQLSYKSVQPAQKGSPLKQHIAFTDRIKLSHRQNMITINYVALNYMSPRKNQYECMLEGQEKEWQKMGTRQEATYTNISPGKYIFHVRASNNDGVWNTEGTRVKIVITPPWWKRWWFRIFIIMLIGYAVYTLIKMRSDAIKHDKLILQRKIDEGEFELQKQRNEIEQHKRDLLEQEKVSSEINWYNEGMTTLGDIISKNSHNPGEMAGKLISGLVEYVEANIGVLYIINEEGTDDQRLEILGSYALDKSRLKKYFSGDEGYLGACYKEKKNIIIDNLPDNYAVVGSGLGQVSLKHLILVPLMLEEKINGIIELASLKKIADHKIELIRKIAENLSSQIEIIKVNEKMKNMFEELNAHTEELNAQKEEMQQNLEEMMATQEEMARMRKKDEEQDNVNTKKNEKLRKSESELKELRKKYDALLKKYEKLKSEGE